MKRIVTDKFNTAFEGVFKQAVTNIQTQGKGVEDSAKVNKWAVHVNQIDDEPTEDEE